MEQAGDTFEEFSIEMGDFQIKKTKKFDRVWNVGEGGSICQIPLVHDGLVYFGACNRIVYAVDAGTGELAWKFETMGRMVHSSPTFWKGRIFIGTFDHNMYSLDAKTGKLIWKFKTSEEVASTPCIEDGRLFFGSRDQNVYCLEAETGKFIWKFKTGEEIVAAPVSHNGRLFIGSFDRFFYCLDCATGRLIWKFETQGEIQCHNMLVRNGVVYITSFDNNLYALDEKTGRQIWKFNTGTYGNHSDPIFHEGRLYLASRDGILFCLSPGGELIWKYSKNEMLSIVEIGEGKIFIGSEDQNLYCLDMRGKELWKVPTQGAIWLKPVVSNGKVFFPCWDCHMYAVEIATHKLAWKFRTDGSPSYLPPPYESFELSMDVEDEKTEQTVKKRYEFGLAEEEENTSTYKSEITYQMGTTYREKGKYQIDSQTEEF